MKKRLFPILLTVLMVFAMMAMMTGAAYAAADATPPTVDLSSLSVEYPEGQDSVIAGDSNAVDLSNGHFVVMSLPQLPTDLGTTGENGSGYKLVFDGTEGKKDYYLTEEEHVTPNVQVYYQDIAGDRDLLESSKYDLKIQRQNSDDTYEDAAFPLTYGENRTATYKISAVAKEDSGCTGETQAFTVTVTKKCKVTFNTGGGSSIDPQYVIPGETATQPAAPAREGFSNCEWCSDENLTKDYYFWNKVYSDITLYTKWYANMYVGVYNESNPENDQCGTFDYQNPWFSRSGLVKGNFNIQEGSIKFIANPAEGYTFKGFYKGTIGSSGYVETPTEDLLCADSEYNRYVENAVICAVFECAGHRWEQKIKKATPTADGRIYQICKICGTKETVAPLLKVSKIRLAGTSYTYTGKAITPKVTVANASETLSAGNYKVIYSNNKKVGTATVKVTLKGKYYEGSKSMTFKINKAANTFKFKAKTATVKYSAVKKKAQVLGVTKVITFTNKGQGTKTYTKLNGNKNITINKTTGKVTVKKGLKKGTYKVKVKVRAAGNANYKASAWKTVIFKVKIK